MLLSPSGSSSRVEGGLAGDVDGEDAVRAAMKRPQWKPGAVIALAVLALTLAAPWVLGQQSEGSQGANLMDGIDVPRVRTSYDVDELRSYRDAADQGEARAQRALGMIYYEGRILHRNYAEAAQWYRRAADQGDARTQWLLGSLYDAGWGVPENPAEAADWYRKAAEQGLRGGQNALGMLYERGRDVPQDDVQAYAWFILAAAQGYNTAAWNKYKLQARMTAEQIAEAQELSATLTQWIEQRQ